MLKYSNKAEIGIKSIELGIIKYKIFVIIPKIIVSGKTGIIKRFVIGDTTEK